MARLYAWLRNDTDATKTITGNSFIDTLIHWGNKTNSKKVVEVKVSWSVGYPKPSVMVDTDPEITELYINGKLYKEA